MALWKCVPAVLGALLTLAHLCDSQQLPDSRQGLSIAPKKEYGYGRPVLAMANSPRCLFNGKPVEDGKEVASPEPCLNCTCSRGILLCYLKTCTNVVAPSPDCRVVRKEKICCPQLECRGSLSVSESPFRTERTGEPSYKYRLRQDENSFFGFTVQDPRTETTREFPSTRRPHQPFLGNNHDKPSTTLTSVTPSKRRPQPESTPQFAQEEDYGSDELSSDQTIKASGYCYSKGYKYKEGMAMLSPTKCEYCYCIRGQQMCVRPKCHLTIEGCVARYQNGYTCCPSHYQCEGSKNGSYIISGGGGYHLSSSKNPQMPANKVSSCNVEGYDFDVGVAVPSSGDCQTCYCTQIGVVCRKLECSPMVVGCKPVLPEGHCCPTQYKCEELGSDKTEVPISHSTDNYDVTVISPSGTSSTSYESLKTRPTIQSEVTSDIRRTTAPVSSETTTVEKQKITVELTEDSNLESISVIPEENLAVLVLTTEDDSEPLVDVHTTEQHSPEETETTDYETTRSDTPSSKPFDANENPKTSSHALGIKQKHKLTSPTDYTDFSAHWTQTTGGTTRRSETEVWSNHEGGNEEKDDSYIYDYLEYDDDDDNDKRQTFSPFADYSDRVSGSTHEHASPSITTHSTGIKVTGHKGKPSLTPYPTPTFPGDRTMSTFVSPFEDVEERDGSAIPSQKKPSKISSSSEQPPLKSTYGTSPETTTVEDKLHTDNSQETTITTISHTTKQHLKQKTSPSNRPNLVFKTKTSPYYDPSRTTLNRWVRPTTYFSTDMTTVNPYPYRTTQEKTDLPQTTNVHTYRPYTRTEEPYVTTSSSKVKQKPQKHTEIVSHRKTTIPQEVADLLWAITKSYTTESQDQPTGTVIEDNHSSTEASEQPVETVHPLALAAPKLIVEETTLGDTHEISHTETTENPTIRPVFNFESPEVIFSNHGPSSHKRPPPTIHDPKLPVLINNHKVTSSHQPPSKTQTRYRPPSTPSEPQTSFFEISNHRPTNSFRRPPSKTHEHSSYGHSLDIIAHQREPPYKSHRHETHSRPELSEDYESYYEEMDSESREEDESNDSLKTLNNETTTESEITNTTVTEKFTEESPSTIRDKEYTFTETASTDITEDNKVTKKLLPSTRGNDLLNNPVTVATRNYENSTFDDSQVTGVTEDVNSDGKTEINTSNLREITTSDIQLLSTIKPKSDSTEINTSEDSPGVETSGTTDSFTEKLDPTTEVQDGPIQEAKLSRADDDLKGIHSSFIDRRIIPFNGKPNIRVSDIRPYPDKLKLKPGPAQMPQLAPPQTVDDSQEITDVCFVDGRYYNSGEVIVKSNPCEMCRCFYGHPLCQMQQCPTPPQPSCTLEYLPGYCCPRVTCGVKHEPDEPPKEIKNPIMPLSPINLPMSPPIHDIRSPSIASDNQWKPLPHGPFLRPTNNFPTFDHGGGHGGQHGVRPSEQSNSIKRNDMVEVQTEAGNTFWEHVRPVESSLQPSKKVQTGEFVESQKRSTTTTTTTMASLAPTTESPPLILKPIFDPHAPANKSEIHDNSSGVRKVVHDIITVPPSKMSLSPIDSVNLSTFMPVINTLPTTLQSEHDIETMPNLLLANLPAELGGNLKVSGCNVYGKYYKINDKVLDLSKPCKECICSADGIACETTC